MNRINLGKTNSFPVQTCMDTLDNVTYAAAVAGPICLTPLMLLPLGLLVPPYLFPSVRREFD